MRLFCSIIIISFIIAPTIAAQSNVIFLIFGNRDASTIYARLESDIQIGLWIAMHDTVCVFHIPLASDDSIIVSRDGGEFFYPLTEWDDVRFQDPNPISNPPGYTNQSLIAYCDMGGDPNPPLILDGDTVLIANYFMHTTDDTTHLYQLVCPFEEGWHPTYGGIDIFSGGIITPIPIPTFSCLFLVDYYPGDANNSGNVNGLDVIYLVNYFKGFGPPPDPMLAGDANGDCWVNGPDVIYLVNYLKGTGQPPFYGDCH